MATGLHPNGDKFRAAGLRMKPHLAGGDYVWPALDPRQAWSRNRDAIPRDQMVRKAQKAIARASVPLLTTPEDAANAKAMQSMNRELIPDPAKLRALKKNIHLRVGKPQIKVQTLK